MEQAQNQEAQGADDIFDDSTLAAEIANLRDESDEGGQEDPPPQAEEAEAKTEEAEEPEAEAKADDPGEKVSELDQKLDQIARKEAETKEKIDAYFAEKQAEIDAKLAQMEQSQSQQSQGITDKRLAELAQRRDLVGLATELGIDLGAEGDVYAKQFYGLSNAAAENPKHKEIAMQSRREREMAAKLSATEQRLEQLEQQLVEKTQAIEVRQEASRYIAGVQRAVDAEKFPLVKAIVDNEPEEVDNMLRVTAARLMDEKQLKTYPEPAEVLAALEAEEQANKQRAIKRYGLGQAQTPSTGASVADQSKTTEQASQTDQAMETQNQTQTTPPADLDDDELDDLLMRELKEKGFFG